MKANYQTEGSISSEELQEYITKGASLDALGKTAVYGEPTFITIPAHQATPLSFGGLVFKNKVVLRSEYSSRAPVLFERAIFEDTVLFEPKSTFSQVSLRISRFMKPLVFEDVTVDTMQLGSASIDQLRFSGATIGVLRLGSATVGDVAFVMSFSAQTVYAEETPALAWLI